MSDQGIALAKALLERPGGFPADASGGIDPVAFRQFLESEFPEISQADIRRGIEIAVELVILGGPRK